MDGHGVVSLHERVKKFMEPDRNIVGIAVLEIIALQHSGNGDSGGKLYYVVHGQKFQPFSVVAESGFGFVQDMEDLLLVGLGVDQHLLIGQRFAPFGFSGGIADLSGKVSDNDHDLMAQILDLPELSQDDGVA